MQKLPKRSLAASDEKPNDSGPSNGIGFELTKATVAADAAARAGMKISELSPEVTEIALTLSSE